MAVVRGMQGMRHDDHIRLASSHYYRAPRVHPPPLKCRSAQGMILYFISFNQQNCTFVLYGATPKLRQTRKSGLGQLTGSEKICILPLPYSAGETPISWPTWDRSLWKSLCKNNHRWIDCNDEIATGPDLGVPRNDPTLRIDKESEGQTN